MIGVVLAAGAGSRLGELTADIPKTLLQIDGERTILDVAVSNLAGNGIREILVVAGYAADRIDERRIELEDRHGCRVTVLRNEKHAELNNAYSLWAARDWLAEGAVVVNGDTVHPAQVEAGLLGDDNGDALLLAADVTKPLGDEEMKVRVDDSGRLTAISKLIDPSTADGEYIGVSLVSPRLAGLLTDALHHTWTSEPHEYYERAYQRLADDGHAVRLSRLPAETPWVEVDNASDLRRARELACRC